LPTQLQGRLIGIERCYEKCGLVTKRPTETTLREVQFQVGSFDRYQAAFDVSGKAANTDNELRSHELFDRLYPRP
jgi:hypothetical protein